MKAIKWLQFTLCLAFGRLRDLPQRKYTGRFESKFDLAEK